MPKYRVPVEVEEVIERYTTGFVVVEADGPDEAEELAKETEQDDITVDRVKTKVRVYQLATEPAEEVE